MKIVAYYRVRKKQTRSRASFDAQKAAVAAYAKSAAGKVIAEFTEVEATKMSGRPQLELAIDKTKSTGATLVIASLDRLATNLAFTTALRDSGIEFAACDNPHVNRSNIEVIASVAETQALAASKRTKDALAEAKAKGVKLGSARPGHWKGREHKRGWKQGAKNSAKVRSQRAASAYAYLMPQITELKRSGLSLSQIAEKINEGGNQTTTGKPFTAVAIYRLLQRYGDAA